MKPNMNTRAPRRRRSRLMICALLAMGISFSSSLANDPSSQPTPLPTSQEAASAETTGKDRASHRAFVITIEDEINDITLVSMKRRVAEAREEGADMVVFEMDTPGGLVSSALEICTFIKNTTDLKTVAWVRPAAYSAGVMISLSCDEVVMASASKMGDCAPIIVSAVDGLQELGETERAKIESPILKEFVDSSHRRGYNRLLCEAMVRTGSEVWWLEKGSGGERKFVTKEEKEELLDDEEGSWQLVEMMYDPISERDVEVQQPVVKERDLLTLTQSEAIAYGFAKAIISTEDQLIKHYNIEGDLIRFSPNWSENVADVLSSPMVRTVLMILIALGAYSEFNAPGTFVGGTIALIALVIFLGAPYLTGLADVWEILLVCLGVILLFVEVFVIPGFGVAGILGILLVFTGLIATFVPAEPGPIIVPRMPGTWLGLWTGMKVVFGGLSASIVGMWFLNKYLPAMPGTKNLFLRPPDPAMATGVSAPSERAEVADSGAASDVDAPACVGDTGITLTKLRPAGKVNIDGRRVDVIAQGQMVAKGSSVEVVEVSGSRIVVRETRQA